MTIAEETIKRYQSMTEEELMLELSSSHQKRFKEFLETKNELNDFDYWEKLALAYQMSDNLYNYQDEVKEMFGSIRSNRNKLMTSEELKAFEALPSTFTIYRAMCIEEAITADYGISWTLNKDIAEFFATTYRRNYSTNNQESIIEEMVVSKSECIALFNGRNESEIIYID